MVHIGNPSLHGREKAVTSMTCEDARECFPLLLEGKIRLTELAVVEAHISQCATCRAELDRLQERKPRARASRALSGGMPEPAVPDVSGRRRLLLFAVLASLATIAILIALAVHAYQQNHERHRIVTEAMTGAGDRAERESREPAPTESPVPPPPPAPAPRPIPPVAQAPRPGVASRSADLGPRRATPLPAAPPASRSAVPPAAPPRESPSTSPATALDVVVQLSVKDRSAAERDLSSLLARVGATQVRRQQDFTFVAVVPQSRYGELTRGMAQIGSWQMETERSTVPDPVHVAVRLVSPGSRRSGPGG